MIEAVGNKHTDATFLLYDMNGVFSFVLDNTAYSDNTVAYIVTTHNCTMYADSYLEILIPSTTYKSPDRPYAVPQYFWFSGYHPTYPLHNLTANELAFGLQHLVWRFQKRWRPSAALHDVVLQFHCI